MQKNVISECIRKVISNAKIINNPNYQQLRELAKKDETTTKFGSAVYITKIRNRSAKFTEIIYDSPTNKQIKTIEKIIRYLKDKNLIQVDMTMCQNEMHKIPCRAYITKDYARVIFMWHEMLFPPEITNEKLVVPKITLLFVPEWPERLILVDTKSYTTIALGSDYSGEMKKAGLRLGMYYAKQHNGLGLHAGSKNIFVHDMKGKLVKKGMLLFGLSATGKTTLTCHHHWLNEKNNERVIIRQDDVVFLWPNGSCTGTENNFYMKTENLDEEKEPLLYNAVTDKNTLIENVKVDKKGKVDFYDLSLTSNGRAVISRLKLGYSEKSIDLDKVDIAVFIIRRNTVVPPLAKLNAEQAAAFFMLGESVETSAGEPKDAGKAIRVVGTNPFIIGPEYEEGNKFYKIIKKNKIKCFLLNTGYFGQKNNLDGIKIKIEDSSAFLVGISRENIKWKRDKFWGYLVPNRVDGVNMENFDWRRYYTDKEYKILNQELKQKRKEWLKKFPKLNKKIRDAIKN